MAKKITRTQKIYEVREKDGNVIESMIEEPSMRKYKEVRDAGLSIMVTEKKLEMYIQDFVEQSIVVDSRDLEEF